MHIRENHLKMLMLYKILLFYYNLNVQKHYSDHK